MTHPKITMTLLVRNEADILEDMIRFHHAMGVGSFIVMDNLSEDATADILKDLSREIEIDYLYQAQDTYDQHSWVTTMARRAATEHKADWVINSDADEFWVPAEGTLQDLCAALPAKLGVMQVPRRNAVIPAVAGDPLAGRSGPRLSDLFERISYTAEGQPLTGKVIHRASDTVEVLQGNHHVHHVAGYEGAAQGRLSILHYPHRSLALYKDKIRQGGAAYARNSEAPTTAGATWRAQYAGLAEGAVETFWQAQARTPEEQHIGLLQGDLIRDSRVIDFFSAPAPSSERSDFGTACDTLLTQSAALVAEFAQSQAALIGRVPRPTRWDRPMYYNLRFAARGAEAHLARLRSLTAEQDVTALCADFATLRDVFSLFPRNTHMIAFFKELLCLALPAQVAQLRADCAGKRVILHTSCHPRLQETQETLASFEGLADPRYHHIVLLGAQTPREERSTPLTFDYDARHLQVPAPDTYEGLHQKLFYAYMLLDLLAEPALVVKIDDNILLRDPDRFSTCLDRLEQKQTAYAGRRVGTRRHQDQWHGWHVGKCTDPALGQRGYQYPLPRDYAAGGYGYVLGPDGLAACRYMYLAMQEFFAMPAVGLEDAYVGHAIYAQRLELSDISLGQNLLAMPGLTTKERAQLRLDWPED